MPKSSTPSGGDGTSGDCPPAPAIRQRSRQRQAPEANAAGVGYRAGNAGRAATRSECVATAQRAAMVQGWAHRRRGLALTTLRAEYQHTQPAK